MYSECGSAYANGLLCSFLLRICQGFLPVLWRAVGQKHDWFESWKAQKSAWASLWSYTGRKVAAFGQRPQGVHFTAWRMFFQKLFQGESPFHGKLKRNERAFRSFGQLTTWPLRGFRSLASRCVRATALIFFFVFSSLNLLPEAPRSVFTATAMSAVTLTSTTSGGVFLIALVGMQNLSFLLLAFHFLPLKRLPCEAETHCVSDRFSLGCFTLYLAEG